MSDELRDLYQSIILAHARAPRNFGRPHGESRHGAGDNPMCGDRVSVYLQFDQSSHIAQATFEAKGCALCIASASLMTEEVRGRSPDEARRLGDRFVALCSREGAADQGDDADAAALERLAVFSGVRAFPSRLQCATLAWEAMHNALPGQSDERSPTTRDLRHRQTTHGRQHPPSIRKSGK